VQCIIDQYDKFIDPDLKVNLKGSVTKREDTADNGGMNLAYRAYEDWLKSTPSAQSTLIALEFTPRQLFWISYSQFYCSVQREQLKKSLYDENEVHSFDRFRVMGPLMNSREFTRDFDCPILSQMNPDRQRCSVW
jgi:neprilysin